MVKWLEGNYAFLMIGETSDYLINVSSTRHTIVKDID